MNLNEKEEYARKTISSLSRHDDENSAVRIAFLNRIRTFIDNEEAAILARDAERIAALTGEV